MNFTITSDTDLAQQLLAVVTEASKRGLLRKSYLKVGPMIATSVIQRAARRAAGLPELQRTGTQEVQQ